MKEIKEYIESIYKEIVAFLNSYSGTIYIEYDDCGNLIGLRCSKKNIRLLII